MNESKAPINVTGRETPPELLEGRVSEETYFSAKNRTDPTVSLQPIHVMLDGVDITNRCSECRTDEGWARVYVTLPDGAFLVQGNESVEEICFGKVEVTLG